MTSWKGVLFAAVLLWAQAQALLHGAEHEQDVAHADHHCTLCLALHGVDGALPGNVPPLAISALSFALLAIAPFLFREPRFFVRGARAPPAA